MIVVALGSGALALRRWRALLAPRLQLWLANGHGIQRSIAGLALRWSGVTTIGGSSGVSAP